MSKKLFTEEEIKLLFKNKYVKKVSRKRITYTKEGKPYSRMAKTNHEHRVVPHLQYLSNKIFILFIVRCFILYIL